mmetsp:Transcript_10348/g.31170  ORF Transcript_10348/g.31170 Transcript_10348/m.31170 type:complete len:235 (+) Transcript_10348:1222-1926(+)
MRHAVAPRCVQSPGSGTPSWLAMTALTRVSDGATGWMATMPWQTARGLRGTAPREAASPPATTPGLDWATGATAALWVFCGMECRGAKPGLTVGAPGSPASGGPRTAAATVGCHTRLHRSWTATAPVSLGLWGEFGGGVRAANPVDHPWWPAAVMGSSGAGAEGLGAPSRRAALVRPLPADETLRSGRVSGSRWHPHPHRSAQCSARACREASGDPGASCSGPPSGYQRVESRG